LKNVIGLPHLAEMLTAQAVFGSTS